MKLYLVRHAIAFEPDDVRWPDDRARPLTEEGKRKFVRAARGLRALELRVGTQLSSTLARAWQTAEILERTAIWPKPTICKALEVGHSPIEVVEALHTLPRGGDVALVSHEPNLHELTSYLLTGGTTIPLVTFRKGGVACLELPENGELTPGSLTLEWHLQPRHLRAIAS